jgi:hypothetical protein
VICAFRGKVPAMLRKIRKRPERIRIRWRKFEPDYNPAFPGKFLW